MAIGKLDQLHSKLERDGVEEVRRKLTLGSYAQRKVAIIEEWLRRKEEELNAPTYMYHEFEAPEGKIFKASEVPDLERAGWVDTPAKFRKGFRSWFRKSFRVLINFWANHWKWTIGIVIAIVGIIATYIKS